jgi:hypothetical protein
MTVPVYIQSNVANNGGTPGMSQMCAYTSNNTAGNLLIGAMFGGTSVGISDTAGNTTWKQIGTTYNIGGVRTASLFYAYNCKAGANTVTFTSGSNDFLNVAVHEYSSVINTSDPLDVTTRNNGNSTTIGAGGIMTSQNNDLIFEALVAANQGIAVTDSTNVRTDQGFESWVTSDRVIGPLNTAFGATATCTTGVWLVIVAAFLAVQPPANTVSLTDVILTGIT